MAAVNPSHQRTHNLLLISKLLSLRDTTSPLTLLLDSLEQPGTPLIREYIRRAKISKVHVTLIGFETLRCPDGVDAFVSARRKSPADIVKEAAGCFPASATNQKIRRRLIIIDALNLLLNSKISDPQFQLSGFLSSFLAPGTADTAMVVVYHLDVPGMPNRQPYAPSSLSLLTYLATTIITLHSFPHILARKVARDRSMADPVYGLEEEQDGILIGKPCNHRHQRPVEGIVFELEHRRKSGRGVLEWYYLPPSSHYNPKETKEIVTLLDDHPLYRPLVESEIDGEEVPNSTFELRLTERQRRDREAVVLPYFDAQKGDGPGQGGRILYDLGEEDDFDEEEDEI